jgi:hypothetical protein
MTLTTSRTEGGDAERTGEQNVRQVNDVEDKRAQENRA